MQALLEQARVLGERLKERGETIAIAETSSGGLISATLLAVPGASAYYLGGGVLYTMPARATLLGISNFSVKHTRSSSEPYAQILAATVRERLGATWGLSETGAAGPVGNPYGDAAGHTCVALAGPVEAVTTLETGEQDRWANMQAFAAAAFRLLDEATAG
ncbi:CinA family protein [Nakamurella leprariae]|uniref:CinA family protein n=1 Tax=Nakamurella leprariae TaxID=2803911 RepID=A0A938YEU2_9ACTN|nr:CinA family protein [Nakamurella leprariae]MBM9468298.1 CinA family protein [Nakamurella leprariae]